MAAVKTGTVGGSRSPGNEPPELNICDCNRVLLCTLRLPLDFLYLSPGRTLDSCQLNKKTANINITTLNRLHDKHYSPCSMHVSSSRAPPTPLTPLLATRWCDPTPPRSSEPEPEPLTPPTRRHRRLRESDPLLSNVGPPTPTTLAPFN